MQNRRIQAVLVFILDYLKVPIFQTILIGHGRIMILRLIRIGEPVELLGIEFEQYFRITQHSSKLQLCRFECD